MNWCRYRAGYGSHKGFPKEWRIGDYGRLRKYSLWDQETSEIGANL